MMQTVARGVASSSRASSSAASQYPCCKKMFVDMSNALSRPNIQWRGKSVAASVPSDSSIPSKVQKRLPKHERRAIVESFVDKYRATNAGKFPSVSLARQVVGGSYYVIREIMQELEYKSKLGARKEPSPTQTAKSLSVLFESYTYHEQAHPVASLSEEIIKETKVGKISGSDSKVYESSLISAHVEKTCDESSSINVDKTKGSHAVSSYDANNSDAGSVKPVLPNDSVKRILEGVENSSSGLSCIDNDVSHGDRISSDTPTTHAAISSPEDSDDVNVPGDITSGSHVAQAMSDIGKDMLRSFSREPDGSRGDVDGLKEAEQKDNKKFPGTKDLHRKSEHEEASPEKSTIWGNLKSLAHGIINFWKN